jgi:hypothetical protein
LSTTSVQKTERLRTARELALKEAIDRYSNEMMSDEEKMLLLDRIQRLKRSLKAS